jgi:hypothetical protein
MLLLPSYAHRAMTDWRAVSASPWPAVGLLIALGGGVAWHARGGWRSRRIGLAALAVLWFLVWFLLPGGLRDRWWQQWIWTWAFSGATILMGASVVREAAETRELGLFFVGLAGVVVFVIVRVVDAQSLVVSGLMLLASAAVLWWLGRMWAAKKPAGGAGAGR